MVCEKNLGYKKNAIRKGYWKFCSNLIIIEIYNLFIFIFKISYLDFKEFYCFIIFTITTDKLDCLLTCSGFYFWICFKIEATSSQLPYIHNADMFGFVIYIIGLIDLKSSFACLLCEAIYTLLSTVCLCSLILVTSKVV